MTDITEKLPPAPMQLEQAAKGDWSSDRLRDFVSRHFAGYRIETKTSPFVEGGIQYAIDCPFCKNPGAAIWLRDGHGCFKCFHANTCNNPKKYTFADVVARFAPPTDWQPLPSITLKDLLDQPDEPIIPVVDGVMGLGDVTAIIAAPKKQKSWFVLQLAASVASGQPFLGMHTTRGNVLMYDNELRLRDLRRRFRATSTAMGLPLSTLERVTLVSRKGQHTTIEAIRDDVLGRVRSGQTFHLVVVDALYKTFAPGTDENSTGDMIHVYAVLEEIAEKANCAVVIVHHATKGSQRGKSNTDVGSGSGVQSRSVDNHVTILPLDDDSDVFVLAATVRNFKPPDPICLRYAFPLWETAPDYTPDGKNGHFVQPASVDIREKPADHVDGLLHNRLMLLKCVHCILISFYFARHRETSSMSGHSENS